MKIVIYLCSVVASVFIACAGQSTEAKQAEADSAYAAQILACVDDAGSLAESHVCRERVDLAWGVKRPVTVPPSMLVQSPEYVDGGSREAGK